jgi:low temperature requirement protein LtrA
MNKEAKQSNEPNNNVKSHDRFFKKSMSYLETARKLFKFLGKLSIKPLVPRNQNDLHRAATMLELLYDLVIVIAVSNASHSLYYALLENHYQNGIVLFLMTFFTLWWIWINFTWFATIYDNDDTLYRLLIFIQIIGAVIFAASIDKLFKQMDFSYAFLGFLLIRISLVILWIRVILSYPIAQKQAIRKIIGIIICQFGWFLTIKSEGDHFMLYFIIMSILELLTPIIIRYSLDNRSSPKWHNHHIVERYAIFTIIVLGECLVAATNLIKKLIDGGFHIGMFFTCINVFIIIFTLWWLYFGEKKHLALKTRSGIFQWGYGHILIFISLAALGPSLLLLTDNNDIAIVLVSSNIMLFLMGIWLVHDLHGKLNIHKILLLPIICLVILFFMIMFNNITYVSFLLIFLLVYRVLPVSQQLGNMR